MRTTILLVALALAACGGSEEGATSQAPLLAGPLGAPHDPTPSCPAGMEWGIGVVPAACDEPGAEVLGSTGACGAVVVECRSACVGERQTLLTYRLVTPRWESRSDADVPCDG